MEALGTLVFLGVVVTVLAQLAWAGVKLARRQGKGAGRTVRRVALLLAGYAIVLVTVALASPRRYRAAGERECFDDWCAAALTAQPAAGALRACDAGSGVWLVTLEVSSQAKRVWQRAADASATVEDSAGRAYAPCGPPVPSAGAQRTLRDRLGPGQSFALTVPFALPAGRAPAGVVIHHGDFPGALIVGADQAALHPHTLLRLSLPGPGTRVEGASP